MKAMILLQDQREKHGHHNEIESYCREHNIEIIRKRLNVGDYMFPGGKIAVDTKQDLAELANDLYRDKLALNKKYKKCWQDGIQLIVLVQEQVKSLKQLTKWRSRRGKINGRFLLEMMNTLQYSYGVKFIFCEKSTVGETIIRLLDGKN